MLNMGFSQVCKKEVQAGTSATVECNTDFNASISDCHAVSCRPVKPPQTEQKHVAAVADLDNIAEQSGSLIAEEWWVQQASVGLVSCGGSFRR